MLGGTHWNPSEPVQICPDPFRSVETRSDLLKHVQINTFPLLPSSPPSYPLPFPLFFWGGGRGGGGGGGGGGDAPDVAKTGFRRQAKPIEATHTHQTDSSTTLTRDQLFLPPPPAKMRVAPHKQGGGGGWGRGGEGNTITKNPPEGGAGGTKSPPPLRILTTTTTKNYQNSLTLSSLCCVIYPSYPPKGFSLSPQLKTT